MLGDRRLRHAPLAVLVGELEAAERYIETPRPPELAEHHEVGAGPAAAIQDTRGRQPARRVGRERTDEARRPVHQKWRCSTRYVASSRRSIVC